jgi:hypothetical protein
MANPDLSEQFTLSCNGWSCVGGNSEAALNSLINNGSPDEACFPYTAQDTTPCSDRCSNWSDRLYKIDDWDHPGGYPNYFPTVAQIKTAIQTYGPVSTYMEVWTDFFSYRGGVYQQVSGVSEGGHTISIVGWIDSQAAWIAKNSWGTDWGETIDFQPTSPGATNGGWFRIKWGEVDIERQTEYVEAGLPNLTDYPKTGWTYSLVPRSSTGCTWATCTLSSTLYGNQDNTYWNFAGINNGTEPASPFGTRFYVDDVYVWWANFGKIGAGGGFWAGNMGSLTVKGGRHTIGLKLDINDQVQESNETSSDNTEYRQFIWSPYGLPNDSPKTRTTPPKKDSTGYSWYNNEGFSFVVQDVHPDQWWSAVGILPSSASADYDLRLWDIGDYTGSQGGFGGGYLEYSSYGGSASDFVIVNDNMAAAGTYYAGVINHNAGSGDFRIEEDTTEKIYPRPGTQWNGPYSKSTTNVLDIYEIYLSAGVYNFELDQTAGTADLGMSLYDDETITAQKNEYMTGGYADSYGDGHDESFQITVPDAGFHALVVWKVDASDYGKAPSYQIAVGTPSVTVTAPNGGETWYAGDSEIIRWSTFGNIGSYVKIEISRNGGSTWSTITSSTPNDGYYARTVSSPTTSTARIRITSTSTTSYTDTSDANFTIALKTYLLTVRKSGTGSGIVTSSPAGINCGAACTHSYADGTSVALTAASTTGSHFVKWTGSCSGTNPVTSVSMTANKTCNAQFDLDAADPVADIKANGDNGPITISSTESLTLTIELDSGNKTGANADWWVLCDTPFGFYRYDVGGDTWVPGMDATYQGPLFDLPSYQVMNYVLPEGSYTCYFGVDTVMNGSLDMGQIYYDSVAISIVP